MLLFSVSMAGSNPGISSHEDPDDDEDEEEEEEDTDGTHIERGSVVFSADRFRLAQQTRILIKNNNSIRDIANNCVNRTS